MMLSMVLGLSAIIGYAQLSESYDDFIIYVKDSVADGFGSEGFEVSKADYVSFGIDFNFGYEVDLGEHLMLALEYNPDNKDAISYLKELGETCNVCNGSKNCPSCKDIKISIQKVNYIFEFLIF